MSERARRALAGLVLATTVGITVRAVWSPPLPVAAPPPCPRPVAVVGAVAAPGIVCLGPGDGLVPSWELARPTCVPATVPQVEAGDRVTVVATAAGCRLEVDRLPAAALRVLRVRIDPNRAGEAELRALPGVGPVIARRIVAERRAGGPYRALEDLRRVRGIGARTLARLRDRLVVRP